MTKMYMNNAIKYEMSGEKETRIRRLDRIIGYACALADHYGNKNLLNKISKFNDYEGTLTVFWNIVPQQGEKEILVKAWESIIGDGAPNVSHEII